MCKLIAMGVDGQDGKSMPAVRKTDRDASRWPSPCNALNPEKAMDVFRPSVRSSLLVLDQKWCARHSWLLPIQQAICA